MRFLITYMPMKIKGNWIFILLLATLTVFYYYGIFLVPFHPDESTHIYMSQDLEILLSRPLSLAWEPDLPFSNEIMLRSLGAPLSKYLIGFSRLLTNTPSLIADWNWSLSWNENVAAGAYPSDRLLITSRAITTTLLLITLVFLYDTIKKNYTKITALLAVIFLGFNPLFLLHGRRAMNEAAALMGICFLLWALTHETIRPWLVGLALAVAFNAKQSAIALLPLGIIAVCRPFKIGSKPNIIANRLAVFSLFFLVITYLMNPFFWKHPIQAAQYSIKITSELQENQLKDYYPNPDDGKKQTLPYRTLALFSNLFLTPPSTSEVANYLDEIEAQEKVYFNFPFHSLGRSLIPASVFLVLTLSGFIIGVKRLITHNKTSAPTTFIFLLATILQFFFILFLLPLPWQRYIVPLLPFTSIWAAIGLEPLTKVLNQKLSKENTP